MDNPAMLTHCEICDAEYEIDEYEAYDGICPLCGGTLVDGPAPGEDDSE